MANIMSNIMAIIIEKLFAIMDKIIAIKVCCLVLVINK